MAGNTEQPTVLDFLTRCRDLVGTQKLHTDLFYTVTEAIGRKLAGDRDYESEPVQSEICEILHPIQREAYDRFFSELGFIIDPEDGEIDVQGYDEGEICVLLRFVEQTFETEGVRTLFDSAIIRLELT